MAKQQPIVTKSQVSKEKQAAAAASKPAAALPFIFDRTNYIIMIAGLVVILIGFYCMSGGASTDMNVFSREEKYSFTRITLAPILVMVGFLIELVAIIKRPKN